MLATPSPATAAGMVCIPLCIVTSPADAAGGVHTIAAAVAGLEWPPAAAGLPHRERLLTGKRQDCHSSLKRGSSSCSSLRGSPASSLGNHKDWAHLVGAGDGMSRKKGSL